MRRICKPRIYHLAKKASRLTKLIALAGFLFFLAAAKKSRLQQQKTIQTLEQALALVPVAAQERVQVQVLLLIRLSVAK